MTNLMTRHVKRATVFTMMLMSIFHAGDQNVPDYAVILSPNSSYRRAIPLDGTKVPASATLSLRPQPGSGHTISRSSITLQDNILWREVTMQREPLLRKDHMLNGFSSQEWVIIDGNLHP